MIQMSLTGEIPLTHTNVLQAVRDEGPITEFDLLCLLGHEINIGELEALDEVVRELRETKDVSLSVFIDPDHTVRHKLHIGPHPDARCPVMGYGREDD